MKIPLSPTVRRQLLSSLLVFLAGPFTVPGFFCAHAAEAAPEAFRDELQETIREARDRVFPALVSIRVLTVDYRGGREIKGQSVGSGTIITAEGHVLTNQHVIDGGRTFLCTLSDKREIPATLLGEDPLTDLAVLQLELEALDGETVPVAEFGSSEHLEIGDYVMAMGSPFSLSRSVSLGIVSNTERVFAGGFGSQELEEMQLERGQRTGLFTRWIQHDAVISPGNSGGPLVNLAGEVVGVNELGSGPLGFAIPSDLARRVADELIEHGEVARAWHGLSFRPIQGTPFDHGTLVSSVVVDGPAGQAGIEAGDLVTAIDGEPLTLRFTEEIPLLLDRLANLPIGHNTRFSIRRGEKGLDLEVTTEKLEKDLGDAASFTSWGFTARQITPRMARELRLETGRGVLITGVRRGGPAQLAEPPLEPGDILSQLEQRPVESLASLVEMHRELEDLPELLVGFARRGTDHLTLLESREDSAEDPPRELPKAWLGLATQAVLPQLAARLDGVTGFRISRIYPGTLAAEADLETGDLIIALDDEPMHPESLQDSALFHRRIRGRDIGDEIRLTVLRDGARHEVPVTLERTRLSKEEARRHSDGDFELSVRELTFFDRDEQQWQDDLRGVLVENVDPAGWAGLAGLRPGDLVLRIEDQEIRGLKSFRRTLDEIKETRPEQVIVVVRRGIQTRFHFLEPDWSPESPDRAHSREAS